MIRTYSIGVKNNGVPTAGLSPVFSALYQLSDDAPVAGPTITEVGGGLYKFTVDVTEALVGVIDTGASIPASSRYIFTELTPSDDLLAAVFAHVLETDGVGGELTYEEFCRFLASAFSVFSRTGNFATFRDFFDQKDRFNTAQDATGRTQVNITDLSD